MAEIDALLQEDRTFPAVRRLASAAPSSPTPAVYARARGDPEAFWAGFARELEWIAAVDDACSTGSRRTRSGSSAASSTSASTASIATCAAARRNKAAIIWEGEPGDRRTLTYCDLLPRGLRRSPTCSSRSASRRAIASRIYLPLIPELAIAMLACARIGAVHSVVFGGFSAESLRDRINDAQARAARHRRRRLPPRPDRAAQADRRRSARATRRRSSTSSSSSARPARRFPVDMQEGRDHWYHRLMQDASPYVRARADGRRGHALHPLHLRHDRQAEGHRPHDRRLPRRHLRDDQVGLRSQGRRRLLVHRRHRLGHRPQLRRLRPARERRDGRDVRRRARLAGEGSLLGAHRAPRRHDLLHRADRDPRVHALGHRVAGEARPVVAAPARLGRRADQPRSVDVVPRAHRRRALPDRRHLVADRDRHDHDHAAAGHHHARSRARRRSRSPASPPRSATRRASASRSAAGCSRSRSPWPSMLRGIYGDPERFVKQYWSQWDDGVYFTGDGAKRDEDGYFWLLGRVDDVLNVAGPSPRHDGGRERARRSPDGRRGRRRRPAARDQGPGDRGVRHAQGRRQAVATRSSTS